MTFKLVGTIQIQFLPYVLYFHACLHVWIIHRTYVPLFQAKYKGMRGDPGLLHNIARNKTMIILVSDKGANYFTITKITLLILWEYVTLNPATCTSKWIHVRPDLSMWTCHPVFLLSSFCVLSSKGFNHGKSVAFSFPSELYSGRFAKSGFLNVFVLLVSDRWHCYFSKATCLSM